MVTIARRVSIGRGRDCDILLTHVSVSRHHAELEIGVDGSLELSDLKSTGGTYIVRGGKEIPVSHSSLKPSDKLRFSEYDISVADLLSLLPDEKTAAKPVMIQTAAPTPASAGAPAPRMRMVRCACGSIKERGKICPDCGA